MNDELHYQKESIGVKTPSGVWVIMQFEFVLDPYNNFIPIYPARIDTEYGYSLEFKSVGRNSGRMLYEKVAY